MTFIIYGKDNCQYCESAKALLKQKSIDFSYLTIGKDYTREELLDLVPDARTLPQIWMETPDSDTDLTVHIGGFTELENMFKNEVEELLKEGHTLRVTFTKADGTERVMLCTRNAQTIAEVYTPEEKKTDRTRATPEGVLPVFDLEKNEWRSFKLDSVKSYDLVWDTGE